MRNVDGRIDMEASPSDFLQVQSRRPRQCTTYRRAMQRS